MHGWVAEISLLTQVAPTFKQSLLSVKHHFASAFLLLILFFCYLFFFIVLFFNVSVVSIVFVVVIIVVIYVLLLSLHCFFFCVYFFIIFSFFCCFFHQSWFIFLTSYLSQPPSFNVRTFLHQKLNYFHSFTDYLHQCTLNYLALVSNHRFHQNFKYFL